MNLSKIKTLFSNHTFILWAYILVSVISTIHLYFIPEINFYVMYEYSFFHLIENKNLYPAYPKEYEDVFLYSPTFSVLMAFFAIFPTFFGIIFWNLFNTLILYYAIKYIAIDDNKKVLIWWFGLHEALTALQRTQPNVMITGLIIFTFVFFERKQIFWATCMIVFGFYIKIYGILGAALFLLYRDKLRFSLYFGFWLVFFGLLPLIFISPNQLVYLYVEWYKALVLEAKVDTALDVSLLSFIQQNIYQIEDKYLILSGIIIFCLPYLRYKMYSEFRFRFLYLANILLWVILFSPASESSTYVIAVYGVAIWYVSSNDSIDYYKIFLMIFVFILTSLSPSDLFPNFVRDQYIKPMVLKALPCILVWFYVMYDLYVGVQKKQNLLL
ncbi:MAG: DUF2029 domain-containing protein [Bacteroidetes bacterium]|nr:MAG: DUF2029 domain-containing protein [Bacteroidota bacterium]TAG92943.1 MAG: DUF2029 domain-containing protein [Bacteroidota bacterium]